MGVWWKTLTLNWLRTSSFRFPIFTNIKWIDRISEMLSINTSTVSFFYTAIAINKAIFMSYCFWRLIICGIEVKLDSINWKKPFNLSSFYIFIFVINLFCYKWLIIKMNVENQFRFNYIYEQCNLVWLNSSLKYCFNRSS